MRSRGRSRRGDWAVRSGCVESGAEGGGEWFLAPFFANPVLILSTLLWHLIVKDHDGCLQPPKAVG